MQFLQIVVSGIAQGCIYGLVALGFVTIYKIPTVGTETLTLPAPYKDAIWKLGALTLNVEQIAHPLAGYKSMSFALSAARERAALGLPN